MRALPPLPDRPWLRDDVPWAWRDDDTVQVGDADRLTLLPGVTPAIGEWLMSLRGDRSLRAALAAARVAGLTVPAARRLLRALLRTGILDDAAECGPLAESVDDAEGVVLVPAFTGLGSPWWDPRARGAVLGVTRGTTRAHLARATVESMAFQTRDVVTAMTAASGATLRSLRVDGGASAMGLLLQLQADQLDVRIERSAIQETTALGAAYLAGLGAGVWSDAADMAATWTADATVDPDGDRAAADAAISGLMPGGDSDIVAPRCSAKR